MYENRENRKIGWRVSFFKKRNYKNIELRKSRNNLSFFFYYFWPCIASSLKYYFTLRRIMFYLYFIWRISDIDAGRYLIYPFKAMCMYIHPWISWKSFMLILTYHANFGDINTMLFLSLPHVVLNQIASPRFLFLRTFGTLHIILTTRVHPWFNILIYIHIMSISHSQIKCSLHLTNVEPLRSDSHLFLCLHKS